MMNNKDIFIIDRNLTAKKIAEAVGGEILCGDPAAKISNVQFDSRAVAEGSLFVPIKGEKVDAHRFIGDCLRKGASAALTEYDIPENTYGKVCIKVDNTLDALQRLAAWYRSQFSMRLVGVTGSVGKTSTKEMIAAALSGSLDVMKTQGNKNSQIGMPCTMFDIKEENEAAVIEMGMSEFGEMDRLCDVARPDIAVMTNIGKAHIENLKTQENIMSEKFKITKHFSKESILFLNGDDRLLRTLHNKQFFRTVTFGFSDDCDYRAENIRTEGLNTVFTLCRGGRTEEITIPALGEHSVRNALAAIGVGEALGLDTKKIQSGLMTYKNAPMRQQIYKLKEITLIDDSYNASPEATMVSLGVLKSISIGKSIAVLADMLELGEQAESEHYAVGKDLAEKGIDSLVAVGSLSENTARGASDGKCENVFTVKTNDEAYEKLKGLISIDCTILVKGSRGMHTEEIVKKILSDYS